MGLNLRRQKESSIREGAVGPELPGGEERGASPSSLIKAGTDGASSLATGIEEPPFVWPVRPDEGRNAAITK